MSVPSRPLLLSGVALLAATLLPAQSEPQQKGVLELVSGERIEGKLDTEEARPGFAWSSKQFRTPLLFDATALSSATFEPDQATFAAKGDWRLALTDGEVLFGDLAGLDADTMTLTTARHGNLTLPRALCAELRRREGGSIVYRGPNCALEWVQHGGKAVAPPATAAVAPSGAIAVALPGGVAVAPVGGVAVVRLRGVPAVPTDGKTVASPAGNPAMPWRAVGHSLVAALPGAELFRDALLACDCKIDCTLSWIGNPGFRMVLGTAAEETKAAVVVEVWDDLLVAFRERDDGIDLVQLAGPLRPEGSARLRITLQSGNLAFTGEGDKELGRLPFPGAGKGIAIRQLYEGELHLDDLRIERTGATLRSLDAARVSGFDAAKSAFQVGETAVPLAEVDAVRFAPEPTGSAPATDAPEAPPAELLLQDGTRLLGDYAGTAPGSLRIKTRWAAEPVSAAATALKQLRIEGNTRPRMKEQFKLAIKEDRFLGKIVGISPDDGTVQWQPTLSKEPAVLQTADDLRFDLSENSAYFIANKDYPHRILFTNRDCVACNVTAITPETITFLEPFHGNKREVPSLVVKSIEFDGRALRRITDDARTEAVPQDQSTRRNWLVESRKQRERNFIDAGRRETVLALPRKYKGNPPTHLVIAENGDVLRGILTTVTADSVNFEMSLLNTASVPRDKVVAMVLFPPEPKGDAVAAEGEKRLVLEVTLDKETRITMVVAAADDKSITGVSPFVGEVTIPWEDVVSMVSGSLRGKAAGFFTAWNLAPMKEPPY